MRFNARYALGSLALSTSLVAAAPAAFEYPLKNGFPKTSDSMEKALGVAAGGLLGNGPPPPKLDNDILTSFKLIAFNELFEVAFFQDLINKINGNAKGYTFTDAGEKASTLANLNRILAQEELHAINANGILTHFKAEAIEPCQYTFPTTDFHSSIALANTFTDVVLGTLGDVQSLAASISGKDAAGVIGAVASVLGQEGQQDGWFRTVLGKTPSAEPFLTPGARDFAWSALQQFTVPGSCPNGKTIPLKVFEPLSLTTMDPKDGPLEFEALCEKGMEVFDAKSQNVVFINGANTPIVKPITDVKKSGDSYAFKADFPHDEFVMDGLTIAVIVKGKGPFADAEAVAKATVFGPALIEADETSKPVAPTYGS